MKLDRLVAAHESMGRRRAHHLIAAGEIQVQGRVIRDHQWEVSRFLTVSWGDVPIQKGARALYLMLHKPPGYLSATQDPQLSTVLDLIDDPDKSSLHLVGRLDRSTTGLLLLTNDGTWSKRLMAPECKVPKSYLVETAEPIHPSAVTAFAEGFYFHTENITTLPSHLEILGECRARLTIYEGRYHQIKRMFHRVQNRVLQLHRESMGDLHLPGDLLPGQWRPLTELERRCCSNTMAG